MVNEISLYGALGEDALFAAMAAVGFSSISHIPARGYAVCALAAAIGHACRYMLMSPFGGEVNIVFASSLAAFLIGVVTVVLVPYVKMPAESCLFPALLPMIPGMYAYRSVGALLQCLGSNGGDGSAHCLDLLYYNSMMCMAIVLGMVIGANIPVYMMKKLSFQATR